ncbi:MAG: hypothetical protein IJO73_02360 [Clostridia bacterium]|nr:hypothetical protein [Clostridia bacterium]
MTLLEMKKKVLGLIEELNDDSEFLTKDTDIKSKINAVINQKLFELARMKKIPRYVEIEVAEGELVDFEKIENESGYKVYQLNVVKGVHRELKAQGTVIKALESGTMEIDFFIYPERITEKTKDKNYEFELSDDALEIMPYGVAGDLLKSDESANFGTVYASAYENMKQELDPRYSMSSISVEGGVYV